MPATYNDLLTSIRKTGEIDAALVAEIAEAKARAEQAACAAIGWNRPYANVLAWATAMVQAQAETMRDNEIAIKLRAALPVSEQWARTAELQAEIAEMSLPPRPVEAARLREKAAALRAVTPYTIAAE